MGYFHSRPVDLRGIAKYLMKLDVKERLSILGDFKKLRQLLFGKDLEQLDPHVSTHGEAWVYAAKSQITSLLFGSSKSNGDLDGIITMKDGKICFKEAYEGAFKERFGGARCMLYEVDSSTFEEGRTSFDGEVVSSKPAKILSKRKVTNIQEELMAAIERGEFELVTYKKDDPAYVSEIEAHIIDRMKDCDLEKNTNDSRVKFFRKKFPQLYKKMLEEQQAAKKAGTKKPAVQESAEEAGGPEM